MDQIPVPHDQLSGSGEDLVGIDLVLFEPPPDLIDRLLLGQHGRLCLLPIDSAGLLIRWAQLIEHGLSRLSREALLLSFTGGITQPEHVVWLPHLADQLNAMTTGGAARQTAGLHGILQ